MCVNRNHSHHYYAGNSCQNTCACLIYMCMYMFIILLIVSK